MKSEIEAKIEYQKVIGDVKFGGYRCVRFSRVKYKSCPSTHIDIRQFQRGYDDEDEEIWHPTKIGFRFPEEKFQRILEQFTLMPRMYIHPDIVDKSFPLLNEGQFESAVIQGFKMIETAIRSRIAAAPEEVGVKLLRKAFQPETGPLANTALPKAEQEAFANYIAGAFAYYKNPCSHRDVEMDGISAFERLVVASDLLKEVEAASNRNEERVDERRRD